MGGLGIGSVMKLKAFNMKNQVWLASGPSFSWPFLELWSLKHAIHLPMITMNRILSPITRDDESNHHSNIV